MVKSKLRGHEIEIVKGVYIYSDNGKSVIEDLERPCNKCNKKRTSEGYDACLGTLKGIMNACCGHGEVNEAYIQFPDEHCIRGKDALRIFEVLRKE